MQQRTKIRIADDYMDPRLRHSLKRIEEYNCEQEKEFRLFLSEIVLMALISFLVLYFFIGIASVHGSSMNPTLRDGQILLIKRFKKSPGYYDIVVAKPDNYDRNVIKRVIATGGDSVTLDDGIVFVNGEKTDSTFTRGITAWDGYRGPVTVPDGKLFLLGDNREASTDSRTFGFVSEEEVIGIVITRKK